MLRRWEWYNWRDATTLVCHQEIYEAFHSTVLRMPARRPMEQLCIYALKQLLELSFFLVDPMNGETIPRLELLGAVVLARLVNTVLTAFDGTLKVDAVFFWSDSQIFLWRIWGVNREFKQLIQNRVVEIRRLTKPTQLNHCPTESNPADICSRGSMTSKPITNQLW